MNAETPPGEPGGASQTFARQRPHQVSSATATARLTDAQCRAGALLVNCSATAAGVDGFTSQSALEANAALASSLAWDLWILVEGA